MIGVTGKDKSTMAAAKPEVLKYQLLNNIATKLQRLYTDLFDVRQHGRTIAWKFSNI